MNGGRVRLEGAASSDLRPSTVTPPARLRSAALAAASVRGPWQRMASRGNPRGFGAV